MGPAVTSVAVVGLGLIGGSVALGIAEHFAGLEEQVVVTGWDPDPATREAAERTGVVIASSPSDAVTGADIVFLCGPLKTMGATATEIAQHLKSTAIVTDVGSVKGAVRSAMTEAGIVHQYVGAHPMAGTESAGFCAANAALLVGATWAVTLDETTHRNHFLGLAQFLTEVFKGNLLVLTDPVHDGAAALISHVPHVLAHALLGAAATSQFQTVAKRLAAGSFRDGTRVARLNPDRNRAMVEDNSEAVTEVLEQMVDELTDLIAGLKNNRSAPHFFDRSKLWPVGEKDAEWTAQVSEVNWRSELLNLGHDGSLLTAIQTPTERNHGFSVTVMGKR